MRLRLILSFVLVIAVTIFSLVLYVRQTNPGAVRAFMYRGGMTDSSALATDLVNYYQQNGSWQGVSRLLQSSRGAGMGMGYGGNAMMNQRLRVADVSGQIVADSQAANPQGSLTTAEMSGAIPLKDSRNQTIGYLLAEGGVGATGQEQPLLNRLNQAAMVAAIIAGGVGLVAALLLAYSLLRPIQRLTRASARLSEGDLSQRVSVTGNDELAQLGRSFNKMAASLQDAQASRRAMTADIAHELRTPLAVQRAQLEALQDGIYPLTAENLNPLLEQNSLLSRLVDDLRTLALADAGELELQMAPADFPNLIDSVVERFRPEADQRKVALEFTCTSGCDGLSFSMDAARIEQILNNLFSNALRYTPEGGRIILTLNRAPGIVELLVKDSGPGIPDESLAHLFERFYRADTSRSRSDGGTGLGLAIARQLARAHGGDLSAANHPAGGAVFTLRLPVK
jgi:two-component system sensor histidine kinase BaeS